ncbi:hypothetical protein DFH07DRAFT_961024 [Mycena maculata]|uniref:Uncharacterized protein n=1 Tax=Mycena maculata TaxID=230809 RepID=A0AAD7IVI2_9AGAR|nr:hypothetical protein DFH07DRAFT_961024 [Mycena maculata]
MIEITPTSRQPVRQPWTMDRLVRERAIALGLAIDPNSSVTYSSALNSYLTFIKLHGLPLEPTEETLSFFTVYMCAHINPRSVNSYLSGICNQLEIYFPDVRARRNGVLVSRTLAGCMRRFGTPVNRKRPLGEDDIVQVVDDIGLSPAHDDMLFLSMLTTGRDGLLRLGEMTFPDAVRLRNARKLTLRHTVKIVADSYTFFLPYHKADRFYEGNIHLEIGFLLIDVCPRFSLPRPRRPRTSRKNSRDLLGSINDMDSWDDICDDSVDFVGSSQPFQDGEDNLQPYTTGKSLNVSPIPLSSQAPSDLSVCPNASDPYVIENLSRRARLVRRCPPKAAQSPTPPSPPRPRRRNRDLVRRASGGPSQAILKAREMERRKDRARQKARHIVKEIRRLATVTGQLRRRHRQLSSFITQSSAGGNKENVGL